MRHVDVNDGIDTNRDDNDIAPFKNILNDMYVKNLYYCWPSTSKAFFGASVTTKSVLKGNEKAYTEVIIRQDLIFTLYRYANYKGLDVTASADISEYTDQAQVSEYARTAISWGEQMVL